MTRSDNDSSNNSTDKDDESTSSSSSSSSLATQPQHLREDKKRFLETRRNKRRNRKDSRETNGGRRRRNNNNKTNAAPLMIDLMDDSDHDSNNNDKSNNDSISRQPTKKAAQQSFSLDNDNHSTTSSSSSMSSSSDDHEFLTALAIKYGPSKRSKTTKQAGPKEAVGPVARRRRKDDDDDTDAIMMMDGSSDPEDADDDSVVIVVDDDGMKSTTQQNSQNNASNKNDKENKDVQRPVKKARPAEPNKKQPARASKKAAKKKKNTPQEEPLIATAPAIVLEEDLYQASSRQNQGGNDMVQDFFQQQQEQNNHNNDPPLLFHDPDFGPGAASILGAKTLHKQQQQDHAGMDGRPPHMAAAPKCRCRLPARLCFKTNDDKKKQQDKNPTDGFDVGDRTQTMTHRCYYACGRTKTTTQQSQRRCNYFCWAHVAERLQWFRLGPATGHVLVAPQGFAAQDLVQGQLGTCWFLSALAVVAERPDLIWRLFQNNNNNGQSSGTSHYAGSNNNQDNNNTLCLNPHGMVQVNLFLDGHWQTVVLDTFLPCLIQRSAPEMKSVFDQCRHASFAGPGRRLVDAKSSRDDNPKAPSKLSSSSKRKAKADINDDDPLPAWKQQPIPLSCTDPHVMTEDNRKAYIETCSWLQAQQSKRDVAVVCPPENVPPLRLRRTVNSNDLSYSKAQNNQLWVPLLEKAYAKAHGSFQAISGGWISEAFLNLTGAPTLEYKFDSRDFEPREFWYKLMSYRRQRLPMGCSVQQSQEGLIGRHAYSILDVCEISNVGLEFFRDKLLTGTLGNVSGFTEFDGKVRLLRIRNPHGKGEWKGEWSDRSAIWAELAAARGGSSFYNTSTSPERTMENDGVFWIDYDSFLLGFYGVDVVLAFEGNHAKSFTTNFAAKTSNLRCTRAFEVSLLDDVGSNGLPDTVEVYAMVIQKTKRGATRGRADRKVSYKFCDVGVLVGETSGDKQAQCGEGDEMESFGAVHGRMLGLNANGHYHIVLNRRKNKRAVVVPIHFGDPAATDDEKSFVVRFVANAPLLVRERHAPRLDHLLFQFCHGSTVFAQQQRCQIVLDDEEGRKMHGQPMFRLVQIDCSGGRGSTVFLYIVINEKLMKEKKAVDVRASFQMEVRCRGMTVRTEDGILKHETVAKMQRFEAAWRSYKATFVGENKSRLLAVAYQSGQDTEFGSIKCTTLKQPGSTTPTSSSPSAKQMDITDYFMGDKGSQPETLDENYKSLGMFHPPELHGRDWFGQGETILVDAVGFQQQRDAELERALAISREEEDLNRAIARSRGVTREDVELQRTIELSKQSVAGGDWSGHAAKGAMGPGSDPELEAALRLSLQDCKQKILVPRTQKAAEVVDLASSLSDEEHQDRKQKAAARPKGNVTEILIDSDDDDDSDIEVISPERHLNGPETNGKIDDPGAPSTDHQRKKSASPDKVAQQQQEEKQEAEDEAQPSVEEKRRLAREAALRRFKTSE